MIDTTNGKVYENLNRSQVAEIVGVCRQTVSQWERQRAVKDWKWFRVYLRSQRKT